VQGHNKENCLQIPTVVGGIMASREAMEQLWARARQLAAPLPLRTNALKKSPESQR